MGKSAKEKARESKDKEKQRGKGRDRKKRRHSSDSSSDDERKRRRHSKYTTIKTYVRQGKEMIAAHVLWATPLFPCVQKARIEIQREVAARRGVNVRAAAVLILQIAGEPGEGEFFVWLAIWRGCKRSKAERLSLIAKRVRRRLIMTLKLLLLREKHCPSVLNRQSECLRMCTHTLVHGMFSDM